MAHNEGEMEEDLYEMAHNEGEEEDLAEMAHNEGEEDIDEGYLNEVTRRVAEKLWGCPRKISELTLSLFKKPAIILAGFFVCEERWKTTSGAA